MNQPALEQSPRERSEIGGGAEQKRHQTSANPHGASLLRVFALGPRWRKKWRNLAMPKTARPATQHRLPHLQRDRHGTFYFRLTVAGKTLRRSLRTKDRALATMLASRLNWEWSMTQRGKEPTVSEIVEGFKKQGRKFDAEFGPDGSAKFTGINTDDDLRRAKELMAAKMEAIGPIEPHIRPLLSSPHFKNYQSAKRIAALRGTIDLFDVTLPMTSNTKAQPS